MKNRLLIGWTRALFTAFLAFTSAFGTSPSDEPGAFIAPSGEPAKIGATAFVPGEITFPATWKWKSAKVKFEPYQRWTLDAGVDPISIRVGEITLDETIQAPYTAYLPVTVTGEGWFYFHGTITFEAPEGEVFA
ncbi:MAG: hypothetical protein LBI57_03255, partial [Helicobacteraceae bacterium]|nr:hypothetical protein [Helicobacteraceae bacterium]